MTATCLYGYLEINSGLRRIALMKTNLLLVVLLLSLFAVSSPVHAASPGCAAVDFTLVNGSFARPIIAMHFNAGEKIVYTVTSSAIQLASIKIYDLTNHHTVIENANPSGLTETLSYTIPASGNYQFAFLWSLIHGGHTTVTATTSCSGPGQAGEVPLFTDGRINTDAAQTASIYCANGGITVYAVVDSVGHLAFKATKAELAAVPAKPAKNTLITSGLNVSLYRLTTGQFQINAPDDYVFTWNGCPAS
jgi:hypothetical protein